MKLWTWVFSEKLLKITYVSLTENWSLFKLPNFKTLWNILFCACPKTIYLALQFSEFLIAGICWKITKQLPDNLFLKTFSPFRLQKIPSLSMPKTFLQESRNPIHVSLFSMLRPFSSLPCLTIPQFLTKPTSLILIRRQNSYSNIQKTTKKLSGVTESTRKMGKHQ